MGSYVVIKEALLVKKKGQTNEYSVVQKLVPATVNGCVVIAGDGGFEHNGKSECVYSIYHGGAFGFSEGPGDDITVKVNVPGYGVKMFKGKVKATTVNGVGFGILCPPYDSGPTAPYTNLFLVVESTGIVFDDIIV